MHHYRSAGRRPPLMALSGQQMAEVMLAARVLPVEKHDLYLERIAAMLAMRGRGHFTDGAVTDAVKLALAGLIQQPAADTARRTGHSNCAPSLFRST